MKLLYRTRRDSSSQGKPRVYYTGHPEDIGIYFDGIADDLLKSQNCAIYYDAEPWAEYDREDVLRELEQMQLFVIPVTGRFLSQPSRALNVEFPFAVEHHIPVLPLMQESGLEEQFNEKCGDLQMLDKSSRDNTALSFEEKLDKFLTSVLVGDELAEKVRAAFDAYVFLSYRKKDRKYAQELMRLIHKNDFCRDIAIWYDEFLTPGENFNEAIGAALKKCSLFTLTVTPSVVEQGNYVMTVEYPEAVKSGKPILPVELVHTDNDALYSCYQGLPPCTDAHDETALSGALLEAVQKLAIRENDASPEHNFFIGLAYLNGIDVEVDRERALSLIKGAAEDGLPEAMEKLVSMYRSGGGVKLDYMEAIRWQEKLAEWRKIRYEETRTEADGLDWTDALWNLGDYWKELAKLSEAKGVYQEMYRVSRLLMDSYGSKDARRCLSISYTMLGGISEDEGKLSEAKEYYREALKLDEALCQEKEEPTILTWRDLSVNYDDLGNISEAEGRLSEAKEYYLYALKIRKALMTEEAPVQEKAGLAISYQNLGGISRAEGSLSEAKEYYLQELKLSKELYEEAPTVRAGRDLAISYQNLGNISKEEGQLSEAKEYYLQALKLRKELYEEAPTVQARDGLSVSYDNLGGISKAEGRLSEAREYYLQALELDKELYEEAPTVQARGNLSISYNKLGGISRAEGKLSEAKEYYLQALKLYKELYGEAPTVQARRNLFISYDKLGSISKTEGQLSEAKEYYLQALKLYKELYGEAPTVQARRRLSVSYDNLGDISKAEGSLSEAKEYYLQALTIDRQLCEETQTVQAKRDLVCSYDKLSSICEKEGRTEDAKRYLMAAAKITEEVCGASGAAKDYDVLAMIYYSTAEISGKEAKAPLFSQAYEIWHRLSLKYPDSRSYAEWCEAAQNELNSLRNTGKQKGFLQALRDRRKRKQRD